MPKTHQIVTGILQSMRAAAFALFIAGAANAQQHSESQPELAAPQPISKARMGTAGRGQL